MAATRFFDSETPTSYSTLNTFGGLSRTVTALPSGARLHYAIVKATGLRKFFAKMAKSINRGLFGRTFLDFCKAHSSETSGVPSRHGVLPTAGNNRKSGDMVSRNSGPKFTI